MEHGKFTFIYLADGATSVRNANINVDLLRIFEKTIKRADYVYIYLGFFFRKLNKFIILKRPSEIFPYTETKPFSVFHHLPLFLSFQSLLTHVSRPTKNILNKLGVFTVSSFHAFICARSPSLLNNLLAGRGATKRRPPLLSRSNSGSSRRSMQVS